MTEIIKKVNNLIKSILKSDILDAVDEKRIIEKIKWLLIEIEFYKK